MDRPSISEESLAGKRATTKIAHELNMQSFTELPIEYRRKWIDFTDSSPQEVAQDISVLLKSLTNVKEWDDFHKIMLALHPEKRIIEGLYYLCHLINIKIDDNMTLIKEGGLLLSGVEARFISSIGEVLLGNEGWNVMLEHGAQQQPLKSYDGAPAPYKATEALLKTLKDMIEQMNGVYLLAIKVARGWKLPEVYKRAEWLDKELDPEQVFNRSYCAKRIFIRNILNQTVSKSLYVNVQCRKFYAKYFQLKYRVL